MILLVGSGEMSCEYAKILKSIGCDFSVIGRGLDSASKFCEKTGIQPYVGGIHSNIHNIDPLVSHAIVAVGVDSIFGATMALLEAGVKNILIEKPGGIDLDEIGKLCHASRVYETKLYVGYNRRFYSSVLTAKMMIENDGGAESFNFEFTEWSHIIKNLPTDKRVKEKWLLANSSHVIDLAFFLGGEPDTWNQLVYGECDWHKSGSNFVGSGVTNTGALFAYHANWNSAGRWGVEILTRERRYILRPLEELWIVQKGSVKHEKVECTTTQEDGYKPGLYAQTEAFLRGDNTLLCSISQQFKHVEKIYYPMAGYK